MAIEGDEPSPRYDRENTKEFLHDQLRYFDERMNVELGEFDD